MKINCEYLILPSVGESIRYYLNDEGESWYNYNDLIQLLMITSRLSDDLFKYKILDDEKMTVDEYNRSNGSTNVRQRYIKSTGYNRIINTLNNKARGILKDMINNEQRKSDKFDEFREEVNTLYNTIRNSDIIDVAINIKNISQSPYYKEVLYTYDKSIDKGKELLIDQIREDIYLYDLDEYDDIEFRATKRKNTPDEEQRRILYKKHREEGKESSCPSWLKDCLR
jgi:hypothetical protein